MHLSIIFPTLWTSNTPSIANLPNCKDTQKTIVEETGLQTVEAVVFG